MKKRPTWGSYNALAEHLIREGFARAPIDVYLFHRGNAQARIKRVSDSEFTVTYSRRKRR